MTYSEAIDAYMEKFGHISVQMATASEEFIVPKIEEALRTGKEIQFKNDPDCDY